MIVVSLFVNPTQFAPGEDLAAYPKDFERDCALAGAEGVDVMFAPEAGEMYAEDHATFINVDRITGKLVRRVAAGTFSGRGDGGGQTVPYLRAAARVFRIEGLSAGASH